MTNEEILRSNRRPPARIRLPLWALGLIGVGILLFLILSGLFVYRTARNTIADNTITALELPTVEGEEAPAQVANPTARPISEQTQDDGEETDSLPVPPVVTTRVEEQDDTAAPRATTAPRIVPTKAPTSLLDPNTYQPYASTERLNILLLGIDIRCDETPNDPTRTDSMILVSVDPVGRSASALSLPRDTWVDIPGFGPDRINKAHYTGQANTYPGGGPGLAMDTVSSFLGLKIDHYITVNFEGFREFINIIDGIRIEVPVAIDDPIYPDDCYGTDPFEIEEGEQNMDGPIALKYARTRATLGGDIDRAERQQAVLMGVRDKLIDFREIPILIAESPRLWGNFQDNVKTSLTDIQVIQLALLLQMIPRENIRMSVIDYSYLYDETTTDGRQVLVPNYEKIQALRDEVFPAITAPVKWIDDLPTLVEEENAEVLLLNGSRRIGLAGRTEQHLVGQGVNIVEIDNADAATYPATRIIDYGDHEHTVLYLTQLLKVPPLNVTYSDEPSQYDIEIILGKDWADLDEIYNPDL